MAAKFQLASQYEPAGDQPKAIKQLGEGFAVGKKFQVLLGATGTGKTFTASNIIVNLQKPTLVLTHNKTLALFNYGYKNVYELAPLIDPSKSKLTFESSLKK